jgi:cyclase
MTIKGKPIRLIARLDIKGQNLIKGVHLEGLRVIGDPQKFARQYYEQGADEIIYMDVVASLYGRNNLSDIIMRAAENVFIPITVGGGIRSVSDAKHLLRSGADKVAVNTAAVANPNLISEIANKFGSQAMVLSIEARKVSPNKWDVYTENGRESTGMDVIEWAQKAEMLGAGEILLTSIDQEGTRSGFDLDLIKRVTTSVSVPVIASGGMGSINHFIDVVNHGMIDAVAIADVLHYGRLNLSQIRNAAINEGILVRKYA